MNDPSLVESVEARMQQIRCDIDGDMENMAASARTLVDWKHYVKTYPWVCLGAAVALGFLIVPKRSKDDIGRSSIGLNGNEWVDMARKGLSRSVRRIERFVAQRPAFCLGAALAVGIALGWWVKRP
jgi:ElaB/YqjD/DUF883 family membrane-anchored ribosome-binding protein